MTFIHTQTISSSRSRVHFPYIQPLFLDVKLKFKFKFKWMWVWMHDREVLGSRLTLPCLCIKSYTHWAISLVPYIIRMLNEKLRNKKLILPQSWNSLVQVECSFAFSIWPLCLLNMGDIKKSLKSSPKHPSVLFLILECPWWPEKGKWLRWSMPSESSTFLLLPCAYPTPSPGMAYSHFLILQSKHCLLG